MEFLRNARWLFLNNCSNSDNGTSDDMPQTKMSAETKRPSSPLLISLEGNIGAGKSTLLEKLAIRLGENNVKEGSEQGSKEWVFLREPVHIWDQIRDASGATILSKFYGDPHRYAFAFQIMAYTTRLHELRRLLKENPQCRGIICERSLEADKHIFAKMLHDDGTMDDVMYQIYERFFGEYENVYKVNAVIYVDADAPICHERITQRSREGESKIAIDYLEKCRQYHETWLMSSNATSSNIPAHLLHLNTNSVATFDLTDPEDVGNQWLNQIVEFLEIVQESA